MADTTIQNAQTKYFITLFLIDLSNSNREILAGGEKKIAACHSFELDEPHLSLVPKHPVYSWVLCKIERFQNMSQGIAGY
jgi:hypothetical protein